MVYIRPETVVPPLKLGDEVQTVAASSSVNKSEELLEGLQILTSWGLRCRSQSVVGRQWGYLAGDDRLRFRELHPKEPAPLMAFARGGWGAARLLERPQPWKNGWLLGFSDVTSILLSRLSAGFDGCIHGPLLNNLSNEPTWSQERLKAILFGEKIPDLYGEGWKNGICVGPLVAANLTVSTHLLGSRHIPDLKGAILILEDIGEEPYRIDRMLTHWRLTGHLQKIVGIGFGSFTECEAPENLPNEKTFQLKEVLKERVFDLGIPVVGDLPIGHCNGNAALPLGHIAALDGAKGRLSLNL